ncbi:MAG: hypothetical protein EF813_08705 [Methanosarcinales archaeon]|nr:MAG: hypothetical protein EF813_08705 [Methanosarcinales archaeon]
MGNIRNIIGSIQIMRIVSLMLIMSLVLVVSVVSLGCVQKDQPDAAQVVDTDGDGWSDEQELLAGTDPAKKDTDGDRHWDPQDENPVDPDVPVDWVALNEAKTAEPAPTPTSVPTPTVKITSPEDGGDTARSLTVEGYGSEPGATIRIYVCTDAEGKQLQSNVGQTDGNGDWTVDSVSLWPESGYSRGEEAVIYAEMTVSEPGVVCIYRSANVSVGRS